MAPKRRASENEWGVSVVVCESGVSRRGFFEAVGVAGLSVGLAGCGSSSEASYRFRMTVEADTAEGVKTGSSVMEARVNRGMAIGDRSGISSSVRGEAVVVELPSGPLFVLLKMPDAGPPLQTVVPNALLGRRSDTPDAVLKDTAALGSTWFGEYRAELPRASWPIMVQFGNLSDPQSVERVSPEVLGIRKISVQTTSDRITDQLDKRLVWLDNLQNYRTKSDNPFTSNLSSDISALRSL